MFKLTEYHTPTWLDTEKAHLFENENKSEFLYVQLFNFVRILISTVIFLY